MVKPPVGAACERVIVPVATPPFSLTLVGLTSTVIVFATSLSVTLSVAVPDV
jgi:hypothetical protein